MSINCNCKYNYRSESKLCNGPKNLLMINGNEEDVFNAIVNMAKTINDYGVNILISYIILLVICTILVVLMVAIKVIVI